ncbi:MAG: DNA polymerase I [Bacteroidia bacterium]|nr:DNA polymerase I [Bacteroidia bacterium]
MSDKKLFLLDAMALIYRAHFAFIRAPRITSKGVNTSAVFGFTNSLLDVLNNQGATHIAVAFDTSAPTFRHEEFPEYKAGRQEVPEDIIVAIPLVKQLLKALNIPILVKDGFEADDLIGTMAKKAESHGYEVYMVTPDKDYAQLVTDKVFLYKPARMGNGIEILNPAGVKENMGVPPEKVIDFLGLKGDKVDNIPGIPKIGDKTAIELIETFGSVEEIVARAEEITKNSIRESVIEFGQQGILSKRLATIKIDVPVDWSEDHLLVGNPDRKALMELMKELEFTTTAQRILASPVFTAGQPQQHDLFGNVVDTPAPVFAPDKGLGFKKLEARPHTYTVVNDEAGLKSLAEKIMQAGIMSFDTETTGLDPLQDEIISLQISVKPGEAFFIHFPEKSPVSPRDKIAPLHQAFTSKEVLKVAQNLKFDLLVLKNNGIEVDGPMFDTMLASYVINPDRKHNMDALARELLNYEPISITSLIGKSGKGQLSMRQVKMEDLVAYSCEDADITLDLKLELEKGLEGDQKSVFETIEMPLVPVLAQMETYGIKIDANFLAEYSTELTQLLNEVEKEIHQLAGVKFNINSPKQLGEVIFEKLQLAKGKKTKTGQYSTSEDILVKLAEEHELPAKVLRFRSLGKLISTYVDALPKLVNPHTGRVHTTYSQAVAATGRLSSNNPNLQNIPIRSDEGREVRKAFIADGDNFVLLAADYSQVELRLMASLSRDPGMIEDFNLDHDIHKATASKVFGVAMEEVTSDMRSKAKMVNFGIIYGISAFGLAQRLGISRTEAAEIIDAYWSKYPRIKAYMDESIQFARDHGYAQTVTGRRRYLPDINSQNQTVRGFAERNAINMPVQGSAADLIKIAMINIHRALQEGKFKSRMLLQVHDELLFEVDKNELDQIKALVKEKMEHAMSFDVKMKVEMGTGHNWLEAH